MEILIHYPTDGAAVTVTDGAQTETVPSWRGYTPEAILRGGRLNLLPGPIANPPIGAQFQRADGAWLLDLRNEIGVPDLILPEGIFRGEQKAQKRGFASGIHYWLAQDSAGDWIVKPGRFHRKIYVTGSANAFTKAKIAQHAGVAETTVTASWLAARPQYGGSEAMALDHAMYILLMSQLNGRNKTGRSDHIFFERGYTYGNIRSGDNGLSYKGESEIHPLLFDAWGVGDDPSVTVSWEKMGPKNIVIRNLSTRYFYVSYAANIAVSGGFHTGSEYLQGNAVNGLALLELIIYDRASPTPTGATWDGSNTRTSGAYMTEVFNVIADGCLVDRNGWAEGYDYNRSSAFPMPPSDRNHGLYWTFNGGNYMIRDTWITRNSSAGQQVRCGLYSERNIYLDNNYATGGGTGSNMGLIHQFLQEFDPVVFGAGYKRVNGYQGVIHGAFSAEGPRTARFGAVVAHLANPDDPAEIADRTMGDPSHPEWDGRSPYGTAYDDYALNEIKVYKWRKSNSGVWLNENVGGLNGTTLDQTTPHRWFGTKLGKTWATLEEGVAWLKDRNIPLKQAAREFNDWVRSRYGYTVPTRTAAATVNFVPHAECEGSRADNRRNWSTLDLPGRNTGDTMNLKSRSVLFGTTSHTLAAMVSEGGKARVTGGLLAPATISDAADVTVERAGTFRLGSAPHALKITADSGLVHLTGTIASLDLTARGHSEVLLGPNANVPAGKKLLISGQRPMVGWDGTGTATLTVAGTLEFRAGCRVAVGGGFMQNRALTGNAVTGDNFSATLADYEELSSGTNNRLWLCDVTGTPQAGETFKYGVYDETGDTKDEVIDLTKPVVSVASSGLPMLQRFRSGYIGDGLTEPTVTVTVPLQSTAQIVISGTHLLPTGYTQDLTGPGITVTNPGGITLPAGVTLTGGKLVYTKAA